jgi:hypothetical protein
MGLLDFLQTPGGQALASGIATYAATARRGTPVNNIGRGLMGGMQGYTGAIQSQRDAELQKRKDAYNEQMMGYNMTQAETARMKAETDRAKLDAAKRGREAEAESGVKMMKALYQGQDFTYEDTGDDWTVMPVSNPTQGQMVKSETGQLGIDFGNYNKGNVKMFGLSEEDMQDIATVGQYDPKRASAMLSDAFKIKLRGNKATEKLTPEFSTYQYAKANGGIPANMTWFEYKKQLAQAGAAQKPIPPPAGKCRRPQYRLD